ncbi:3-deoxy-D-manno-octulosonic acid transferase [Bordetella sp. 15P40C-2]|uniref:3-deoxy-D-manno-octulosonic acid transferase n=1 Tax=Bordetella sp. 15P40C-2 TaxID=2572246 RepID=UPI001329EFE9|nr:3-deoxy-D-manno-octulosonic acid transferase [Bordetella sp. 15P40C-2]MVW71368.1 3-deoxy-D-manno-octulosonic acid transferase [Bordetella sp. 15P40C-2]
MRRGTYTLALYVLAPLIWLWMLKRARRAGGEWGIWSPARFGRPVAQDDITFSESPVWVHAVSLGETRAAQSLIQALLDRGLPVLLTHTTATGRAEGARLFSQAIQTGQLRQTWLPYDFPGAVRRFFSHVRPRCGLLIEREVWPNLLAEARRQGIRMALVSARFSESSLREARWLGRALREALGGLDAVLAQTSEDAERLRQAGARAVTVTGNLKFDMRLPEDQLRAGRAFRRALARPVVVIASTREGEDALFARAIRGCLDVANPQSAPRAGSGSKASASILFILIPRHPQRFSAAAIALDEMGLTYHRRSQMVMSAQARKRGPSPVAETLFVPDEDGSRPDSPVSVLLGDSLGEMAFYYGAADVAIVGGSFLPFGGQNLIEACAAGVPTIVGPHTFNFKQAAQDAIAAGGVCRAGKASAALQLALALVDDEPRRAKMGRAAASWAAGHAGATERTLGALRDWDH